MLAEIFVDDVEDTAPGGVDNHNSSETRQGVIGRYSGNIQFIDLFEAAALGGAGGSVPAILQSQGLLSLWGSMPFVALMALGSKLLSKAVLTRRAFIRFWEDE